MVLPEGRLFFWGGGEVFNGVDVFEVPYQVTNEMLLLWVLVEGRRGLLWLGAARL